MDTNDWDNESVDPSQDNEDDFSNDETCTTTYKPSTKQPITKKRKHESSKSKEDITFDEALGTLKTVKDRMNRI